MEGELKNGEKKIGKGKKYNYNGKLVFEYEYINGKINGKGKEFLDGEFMPTGDEKIDVLIKYVNDLKSHIYWINFGRQN